jgi:anti-sigma factor ChrR (cupin superfamily)
MSNGQGIEAALRGESLEAVRLFMDVLHLAWEPFRDGIEVSWLLRPADSGQPAAALLRYAPGAAVPLHRHPARECIYVLSGSQVDERGTYPAGTLVVNEAGSSHSVVSPDGCVVLVAWERPVEFY